MPPRARTSALAAVAGLLAAGAARAEPVLRPEALPADEYAETFTFVADLDDGTYVQLQLAVTNLGPGAGTGLCRALVKRPGAAAWTAHTRLPRGGWRHQVGAAGEVLTVGPCSAASGDGTRIRAALDGRAVELAFPGASAELAAPPDVREAGRQYRSAVLQAFTAVSARLEGFGVAGPLAGGGYADHSRSDLAPAALALRWVRFRALRPPRQLLVLGRQRPDGTWAPAWIWRQGEAPHALDAIGLRRAAGPDGAWTASLRDGAAIATVASGPRLHRHAPLQELGALGRLLDTVLDAPVTTTYRATLEAGGPVEGILEVSVLGEE
jgi:hypothetical protein